MTNSIENGGNIFNTKTIIFAGGIVVALALIFYFGGRIDGHEENASIRNDALNQNLIDVAKTLEMNTSAQKETAEALRSLEQTIRFNQQGLLR